MTRLVDWIRHRPGMPSTLGLIPALLLCLALPAHAGGTDSPPALEGQWARKVVLTSISRPPIIGKIVSRTITYQTIDLKQTGREVVLEPQTCDLSIETNFDAVRTTIPERFIRAIPNQTRNGLIVAAEEGPELRVMRNLSVLGAELRAPRSEFLPDSSTDPRLVDADGDGKPGVTVEISGLVSGKVYLVQRAWDRWSGPVDSERRVSGLVDWKTEQSVVGSSSIFLGEGPDTRRHPDDERSYFEMVRIPSTADCSYVTSNEETLFEK